MTAVFLHIGLPGTETTALQNFFRTNDEAFCRHGICLPDLGSTDPDIDANCNAHFLVSSCDTSAQTTHFIKSADYTDGLDWLAALAKTHDKILLTDARIWHICSQYASFWPMLKEDFALRNMELKVIVYLQRQDEFVQSCYRQYMKEGGNLSFYDFLDQLRSENYPLDFYAAAEMISNALGKENLILRICEQTQYHGSERTLISDFLDIFGLSVSDDFAAEDKLCSQALHGSYLEMRRLFNTLPKKMKAAPTLTKSIQEIQEINPYTQKAPKQTLFLPGDQSAFLEYFAESNSRLAREYLGRTDGTLFYDPVCELPYEQVSTEELLRDTLLVYGRALQTLDRQNKDLKKRTAKLEEALHKNLLTDAAKRAVKKLIGRK